MNLVTTVVGSYPTRPTKVEVVQAQHGDFDPFRLGTKAAIEDQLGAGVDIVSDGQINENGIISVSKCLGGFIVRGDVSEIVDKVHYKGPIVLDDFKFAKDFVGDRAKVKYILMGPCTMGSFSNDRYYKNEEEMVLDIAETMNREVKEAEGIGAKFIQIDEPVFATGFDLDLGKKATDTVLRGVKATRMLHVCGDIAAAYPALLDFQIDVLDHEFAGSPDNFKIFEKCVFDKELGYGCINTASDIVESVNDVQRRISRILDTVDPKKVYIDPDCGFRNLPREIAFKKLCNMVAAAKTFKF